MPDRAPDPTGAAPAITPDARLGELLARWPDLEEVLVALSPHFKALRSPVLRRTVAKVATLRQVSQVSGVALGVLIERIRAAVGTPTTCPGVHDDAGGTAPETVPPPTWAVSSRAARSHDARAAIEAGEHPMPAVMQGLAALGPGEVYELVTPFVPAPLLDLARGKGFDACAIAGTDGAVRTFFRRPDGPSDG